MPLACRTRVGSMCCVAADDDVLLPARVVGPSLAAAGLAAWLLVQAGREQEASQCGEIQDLMDTALRQGRTDVSVSRPAVMRAADLWEATAAVRRHVGLDERSTGASGRIPPALGATSDPGREPASAPGAHERSRDGRTRSVISRFDQDVGEYSSGPIRTRRSAGAPRGSGGSWRLSTGTVRGGHGSRGLSARAAGPGWTSSPSLSAAGR